MAKATRKNNASLRVDDVFVKKTVTLAFKKHRLTFYVSQSLFSSFEVDVGTRLLLRSLEGIDPERFRKVLDVGCGYGPLGIALKKVYRDGAVHMVDRDALAVDFTKRNVALNAIDGATVYASLCYDDVRDRDFDLIVSNIPAKAGPAAITYWLQHASSHLQEDGLVAVVVIAPIAQHVRASLRESADITVVYEKATSAYTAIHYRYSRARREEHVADSIAAGIYDRGEVAFQTGAANLRTRTVYGLPEFDELSLTTHVLLAAVTQLSTDAGHVVCLNPGQGHLPVAIARSMKPPAFTLVDRDLLALRNSLRNLRLNECAPAELRHDMSLAGPMAAPTLIVWPLREEEGRGVVEKVTREAALLLQPRGKLLIAGSSTAVTRVIDGISPADRLRIDDRKRKRGISSALFTKQ